MGNETPLDITLDNDPQQLFFSGKDADPITLTITNNDTRDAASVLINVVRADLLNKGDLSLSAEELAGAGYQIINDTWIEARAASPDAWEPIDDWATPYNVGPVLASASASFQIRINTPIAATDYGRICFSIQISSKPADAPTITSIAIDQANADTVVSGTTTLTATLVKDVGADATILWATSDDTIASVDTGGIVTGVATGKAIITATAQGNTIKQSSVFSNVYANAPIAGMSAWYDFSDTDTITDVAGEVTAVTDKSGNGYDLAKASAIGPLTEFATLNSRNVLSFFGNNHLDATGPLAAGSGDYTAFIVWGSSVGAPSPGDTLFQAGTGAPDGGIAAAIYSALGVDYVFHGLNETGSANVAIIPNDTQPMLLQSGYDGAEMLLRISNKTYFDVTATKAYSSKNTGSTDFTLGAQQSGLYAITGIVAEVLLYNSTLTSAEITQNRLYLLSKWGL